jgi:hypothetical protein
MRRPSQHHNRNPPESVKLTGLLIRDPFLALFPLDCVIRADYSPKTPQDLCIDLVKIDQRWATLLIRFAHETIVMLDGAPAAK